MKAHIVVEGQTEEIFVNRVLTPYLAERGVYLTAPQQLITKRLPSGSLHRGGIGNWEQIDKHLRNVLADTSALVTTMFDFYGFPIGHFQSSLENLTDEHPRRAAEAIERAMRNNYSWHDRFIPFLSLHEFEAWLFTDIGILCDHFARPDAARALRNIIESVDGPELINGSPHTHPKQRIAQILEQYKPMSDGPLILEKIRVDRIRSVCPHFDAWLNAVEAHAS